MSRGRRTRPQVTRTSTAPVVMTTFQVVVSQRPQIMTVTRQKLYADGHETNELVGKYTSIDQMAQATHDAVKAA